MPIFYEFFAGGGMARLGLGKHWTCAFANDFDESKAASYRKNFGADHLVVGDIAKVTPRDLPGTSDLVWASFPCQDLSLAGKGRGLSGERSGTFWALWRLMEAMEREGRPPKMICLENVCGAITSNAGKDFATLVGTLAEGGYRVGALVIDAANFVPQSRPRLFIVAAHDETDVPTTLTLKNPSERWHSKSLIAAYERMPTELKEKWLWWNLPAPSRLSAKFIDLIEEAPKGVRWDSPQETARLLEMMSDVNLEKVKKAQKQKVRCVGTVYKRTRNGVQRAEVRFDDVAGCLRTPSGGSSRQRILLIEGGRVRSRLISAREAARLMGLPEEYELPENYNSAYHLAGDGLVVPAVNHLATHILNPLVKAGTARKRKAA